MPNDFIEFAKIKDGDVKAFERVFRSYYIPLNQYAYSITGQKETAEEIVQDTFYNIWKGKEKIWILNSLKSYLYKSVKNRSLQYLEHLHVKECYRNNILKQNIVQTEISPDEILENKETENLLKQTLKKLPERRKQIFYMHHISGKKYKEIAEILSVSVKTVEAEMTKTYKLLRNEINKYSK
jgi:RNA polymerase sigma-70 factor (ECF subfamily)